MSNLFTTEPELTGPSVNRHRSEQSVATPWEFIRAVERKFGPLAIDLAATDRNHKARKWITPEQDTFKQNWAELLAGALGWLNPEFDPMRVSVEKCALEQKRGASLLALGPAAVGTNWFWDFVQPFATVYCLTPRIVFDDCYCTNPKSKKFGQLITDPYPKDLMLSHYNPNPCHELQRWKWK